MTAESTWAKAQAEYIAGASLASICKRFKIVMRELLKRIKDEGWLRAGQKPKQAVILRDPAIDERTSTVRDKVEQAVADIIDGHRSISLEMRENLESEIAEYQQLKQYMISVATHKETFDQLVEAGDSGKLLEYLKDCFEAFGKRVLSVERLVRLAALLISTERTVWGIDATPEGAETESYDDLLELCQQPLLPRSLPPNVTDFEQRLRERQGG